MNLDLDIPSLLSPFDGDSPAGTDLRLDDDPNNAYRKIRDARSEAKDLEERAELDGETSSEAMRGWRNVWSEGQDYLQNFAKDLEIVAYMVEASVRVGGFAGLEASLLLTTELVENFWGELLPTPDEDGIETTLLPIARLNSNAITSALQRVPITDDSSVGEFGLLHYAQAKRLDTIDAEERDRQMSRGAVTTTTFNQAVSETSADFLRAMEAQIESAAASVDRLDSVLNDKAGEEDAPNLSKFRDSLKEASSTLRLVSGGRLEVADDSSEMDAEEFEGDESASGSSSSGGRSRAGISSRQDALDMLEKVAVWFEQHEPQSILISEIRKVKRRALMSPEELYKDLITDSAVREQLFRDVGIESTSDEDDSY
ncbi:MAG: type VI secretion system protein TssA [Fuerstiella sp.]